MHEDEATPGRRRRRGSSPNRVGSKSVDVLGVRRAQQPTVQAVGPRVVGAAQRLRAARGRRIGVRVDRDDLRAAMPADVEEGVQRARLVRRDEDALAGDVDHGETVRLGQAELVPPPDAEPLALQHHVALAQPMALVDVVRSRQGRLERAHRSARKHAT